MEVRRKREVGRRGGREEHREKDDGREREGSQRRERGEQSKTKRRQEM